MPRVSDLESSDIAVKETPIPLDIPWARDMSDTLYVNYLSSPDIPVYRTTDWKSVRHYEWLKAHPKSKSMGMPTKVISPGKIHPHRDVPRILEDLRFCNIYPFGRFGRWAPDELVHLSYKDMLQLRFEVAEGRLR